MVMKNRVNSEMTIKKVGDDMVVLGTVKVVEVIKNVTSTVVKEDDITKALADKINETMTDTLKDFEYKNPVPYDFKYPELIPTPTEVPVPSVNQEELAERLSEAIGNIDFGQMIREVLQPVEIKVDKIEYVPKKIDVPELDVNEVRAMMRGYIREALKEIDMKALLKEVLGEVDLTVYNPVYKDLEVPVIKKGREVVEYTITKRNRVITLTGYNVVDEIGEVTAEIRSDMDVK